MNKLSAINRNIKAVEKSLPPHFIILYNTFIVYFCRYSIQNENVA